MVDTRRRSQRLRLVSPWLPLACCVAPQEAGPGPSSAAAATAARPPLAVRRTPPAPVTQRPEVRQLIAEAEADGACHLGLAELLREHTFVGMVGGWAAAQGRAKCNGSKRECYPSTWVLGSDAVFCDFWPSYTARSPLLCAQVTISPSLQWYDNASAG